MQKTMFFDRFGTTNIAAVVEAGKLVEFHADGQTDRDTAGNIYKGRVVNVLAGMQAAFVAYGADRNGYLAAGDMPAEAEGDVPAELNVKVGDTVMVQVSKAPIGTKGARLTMNVSFVGKNLIYLPSAAFCAISRKITDEQTRERMLNWAKKLAPEGGVILRTQAEGARFPLLKEELRTLRRMYEDAREAYESASVGDCVFREGDLHARLLRDFDLTDVDKVYIGDAQAYARAEKLFASAKSGLKNKLVRYTGEREMFEFFGLEQQLCALTDHRVELESGAYLIIDKTEALTAIDVNTGKFTGETGLEDTVFRTNLLAAREIARQVRLRNIGGIVVVDFIDMASEEHRLAVTQELENCLRSDRAQCNVMPMTEFGLVQFTRKKVKCDNMVVLTKPCPHCSGAGSVPSDEFLAFRIQSALKKCFAEGYKNAVVELNAGLYAYIVSTRRFSALVRNEWREKRVYMIPHRTYHEEQFTVRGDNGRVLTLPDTAKLLY